MDGVLVVDKPEGITSHDAVAAARRLLGERRVGHTGTLDPLATGVLPLACGRATRLVRFLSASEKVYEATVLFGVSTDTLDITGAETGRSVKEPTRDALVDALAALTGEYLQSPPAYSAKKVGGRRAYDLARRDEPVSLAPVPVRVSHIELLAYANRRCQITITCSAGFYVRALARDLGERCGTLACLEALRRTKSGDFTLEEAVGLDALADADDPASLLIPMDRLLPNLPAATLTNEGLSRASHGQSIRGSDLAHPLPAGPHEWVRLLDGGGGMVGLGTPMPPPGVLHPAVVLI